MLLRNILGLSLLTAGFLLSAVGQASAGAPPPKEGDYTGGGPGDPVTVRAGTSRRAVETGAEEGASSDGCNWSVYVTDDLTQPMYENGVDLWDNSAPIHYPGGLPPTGPLDRLFSVTGRWFSAVGCNAEDRNGVYAEGDAISLPELVDEALALLDPPTPAGFGTSPPDDKADRFPVVRIPTWFWIDEPFRSTTFSARASYPPSGPPRVWADAYALAANTEWFPDDGTGWFDCPDLGLIYQPTMSGEESDCTHTYLTPSVFQPGDVYATQARVQFDVWWESSLGSADQGPLPPIERESPPIELRVGEIQAVSS